MIPCFKCPVLGCCLKILFICFISIGHLLGLSHDDSKFCEENFGSMEDKRLMSSILTSIDSSKPWSKCTSATITEFFDDGHGMYYHTFYQLCVSFYCDLFFNKNILYQLVHSLLGLQDYLGSACKTRQKSKRLAESDPPFAWFKCERKERVDVVCVGNNCV